jgi:hypothetical protein
VQRCLLGCRKFLAFFRGKIAAERHLRNEAGGGRVTATQLSLKGPLKCSAFQTKAHTYELTFVSNEWSLSVLPQSGDTDDPLCLNMFDRPGLKVGALLNLDLVLRYNRRTFTMRTSEKNWETIYLFKTSDLQLNHCS